MAETKNKIGYVDPITIEKKKAIVDASVQSMNKRPTSDETAMKKRFVQPIVNLDGTPCLADEVDRIATEANYEIDLLNEQAANFDVGLSVQLGLINMNKEAIEKAKGDISQLNSGLSNVFTRVDSLNDRINSFKLYEIVPSLRPSGDTNKLYLVPSFKQEEGNILEEWLWVNDAWEMVGTKKVEIDLTPYAKKDEVISLLQKGVPNGVATLDANGKVPAEQLPDDIGGGIDEEALKDYVKFTDYATARKAGVVSANYENGIGVTDGHLFIYGAEQGNIKDRRTNRPITPTNLNSAVKEGVTTNTETLTDVEKASACDWIGALKAVTNTYLFDELILRVYCVDNNGIQQIAKTTDDTDVLASKKYVDELIADLQAQINALK